MKLIKLFLCLIIIFLSTTVSAEFYKYVDKNGNTCFTDDFNKVPDDQRAGLKWYEENKSDSDTDTIEKKAVKENKVQDEDINEENLERFHNRLSDTRLNLVKENEEIKKEKELILEDGKNAKTSEDVSKVNERVKNLNKRQEDYNKKYETYEAERKNYREQIEEAEAKAKEKK